MRRTRESSSGESDIDCNTPKPGSKAQRIGSESGENVPVKGPDKNIMMFINFSKIFRESRRMGEKL